MYPATSGKEQAAHYLIQQLGAKTANCSLLCDDDNDLSAPQHLMACVSTTV